MSDRVQDSEPVRLLRFCSAANGGLTVLVVVSGMASGVLLPAFVRWPRGSSSARFEATARRG